MLSTLLALTAATGALAAPAPQTQAAPPEQILPPGYEGPWAWHISGWEAGCGRQYCTYNFNVSVPAIKGQPNYGQYYCNGYENNGISGADNFFAPCKSIGGPSLEAAARFRRRGPGNDYPRVIEVSVKTQGYEDKIRPYNFTAYGDVKYNLNTSPALEFDIYPTVWQQLPYPGKSN